MEVEATGLITEFVVLLDGTDECDNGGGGGGGESRVGLCDWMAEKKNARSRQAVRDATFSEITSGQPSEMMCLCLRSLIKMHSYCTISATDTLTTVESPLSALSGWRRAGCYRCYPVP